MVYTNATILVDIMMDKTVFESVIKSVETMRFGMFKFQVGLNETELSLLLQRVEDAQERFASSPLAHVANALEQEVVVRSVFGTNTIEGGELSEEETEKVLQMSPEKVQSTQQRRALNIKHAYEYIQDVSSVDGWNPSVENVLTIHRLVYAELGGEENKPGVLRDNPKDKLTKVGNSQHGGVYKPPQLGKDIRLLLNALLEWNQTLEKEGVSALIRAPLVHLYFELIHPFWDGNGRVGRVLEAGILSSNGFKYAPFAQANFYLKNIDSYFTLFNTCRKKANKKHDFPNAEFVTFFLQGILETINHLHDRVNSMIHVVLFEAQVKRIYDEKGINDRQYAIINEVFRNGRIVPIKISDLKQLPWYIALYSKLTDKTKKRDLSSLQKLELMIIEDDGQLLPGFIQNE
jgi:Fic family protein